jgi:membrane protein DedA with SNARE-associated domain
MGHLVSHLIDQYGYAMVLVLVFAEGVGLPLSGETALITSDEGAHCPRAKVFTEHGPKAAFAVRFIAIVRVFAGVLAGVTRMPFWVFFLWNVLGAIVWSLLFGTLGYLFGDNLPQFSRPTVCCFRLASSH